MDPCTSYYLFIRAQVRHSVLVQRIHRHCIDPPNLLSRTVRLACYERISYALRWPCDSKNCDGAVWGHGDPPPVTPVGPLHSRRAALT